MPAPKHDPPTLRWVAKWVTQARKGVEWTFADRKSAIYLRATRLERAGRGGKK